MMLGGGGERMLGAIGHRVQPEEDSADWIKALDSFKGLRLPDRGKFAGMKMTDVACQYPKYIVFTYEKGADHFGIPYELYLMCADAVVRQIHLRVVCKAIRKGKWAVDARVGRYRGGFAQRLHMFADPDEPKGPVHHGHATWSEMVTYDRGQEMKVVTDVMGNRQVVVRGPGFHPNCRSVIVRSFDHSDFDSARLEFGPLEVEMERAEPPEEPSFLDEAKAEADNERSFLDGVF
jgi:hypothetical protein